MVRLRACVPLLLAACVACGSAGPTGESAGPPASTTAPDDAAPPPISVQGYVHASDGTLLPGASVCAAVAEGSAAACTTSDANGAFSIAASASALTTLTFSKDGYLPTLRAIATQTSAITLPEAENQLWPTEDPQTFFGTPVVAGLGQIQYLVLGLGSAVPPQVTVALSGGGPNFGTPVTEADAAATNPGTSGAFANVPEGLYILRFGGPGITCVANYLYGFPFTAVENPIDGVAAVVVPVLANTVTAPVAAICSM